MLQTIANTISWEGVFFILTAIYVFLPILYEALQSSYPRLVRGGDRSKHLIPLGFAVSALAYGVLGALIHAAEQKKPDVPIFTSIDFAWETIIAIGLAFPGFLTLVWWLSTRNLPPGSEE